MEEHLNELNDTLNKRVSQLRDNLQAIAKMLDQQKTSREHTFEAKQKDFQDLELAFN